MISHQNGSMVAKITDFGLATFPPAFMDIAVEDDLAQSTMVWEELAPFAGSPTHSAPEVQTGQPYNQTVPSDVIRRRILFVLALSFMKFGQVGLPYMSPS